MLNTVTTCRGGFSSDLPPGMHNVMRIGANGSWVFCFERACPILFTKDQAAHCFALTSPSSKITCWLLHKNTDHKSWSGTVKAADTTVLQGRDRSCCRRRFCVCLFTGFWDQSHGWIYLLCLLLLYEHWLIYLFLNCNLVLVLFDLEFFKFWFGLDF